MRRCSHRWRSAGVRAVDDHVDSRDEKALLRQIEELQEAGCQIVRIAVFDNEAAAVLASVRKKVKVPLVADIHFDYRLALAAIRAGADKIRINPAISARASASGPW